MRLVRDYCSGALPLTSPICDAGAPANDFPRFVASDSCQGGRLTCLDNDVIRMCEQHQQNRHQKKKLNGSFSFPEQQFQFQESGRHNLHFDWRVDEFVGFECRHQFDSRHAALATRSPHVAHRLVRFRVLPHLSDDSFCNSSRNRNMGTNQFSGTVPRALGQLTKLINLCARRCSSHSLRLTSDVSLPFSPDISTAISSLVLCRARSPTCPNSNTCAPP
jgi:hypothetical protein